MGGAEGDEVQAARDQHDYLPDERDRRPSLEGRSDTFGVGRTQRVAKQPVVEAVLNRERDQESDQAEAQVGTVAQLSPMRRNTFGGSGCTPELEPNGRPRSRGPSAGWA